MPKPATISPPELGHDPAPPTVASNEPRPAARPRRTFTVEQKRAIIAEAALCSQVGDLGALLRKHSLYRSTLSKWRKALGAGQPLRGPGRPPKHTAEEVELLELRQRVAQLELRAKRAEELVDFQKKAFLLLDAAATLAKGS